MGERGLDSSVRTVDIIIREMIEENREENKPVDNLEAILERLAIKPDDDKAPRWTRAALAVGICASAFLLSASASPESAAPIAPPVQMHGEGPANVH